MKSNLIFSLFLSICICSTVSYGQSSKTMADYLNVPGPIVVENKSYHLVWSSHPSPDFYKQEYITKGDVIEKFKTMVLLDVNIGKEKIKDIVAAKASELKKMKETNPIVNYEVFEKNGEYILDFLLSANNPDGKSIDIIERNVYRYKAFTDKSGQKGTLLFGISTRGYGTEVEKFLTDLKSNKQHLVNEVAKFIIPSIRISK